jgi:predicted  nucleic acid-binding Zn-ribbon protein
MHGTEGNEDAMARLRAARERVSAALSAIAVGTEALASRAAQAPDPAELDRLRAELDEERTANAQLQERIRALRERGAGGDDSQSRQLEQELAQARDEIARLRAAAEREREEIESVLRELAPIVEEAR